ncbi:hypothetical protein M2280_004082 [Prescottella agglutinans]|uniref:SPOR domain-containing protein n=1 Tax=Prescottella agglutinans TaxID=1644129 RepID=A0ABT6MG26_9NOCA|nr:hypothetical protein [Prescottella agglutinans]
MNSRYLVRKRPENWMQRVRRGWPERPKWLVYEDMHIDYVVIAGFPSWGEAIDYARLQANRAFDEQERGCVR